jgi:hypothetical protein
MLHPTDILERSGTTGKSGPTQERGAVAAAIMAAAIGCFAVSLFTFLGMLVAKLGLSNVLLGVSRFRGVVITLSLGVWLFSWVGLFEAWRGRTIPLLRLYAWSTGILLLTVLILLLSFSPWIS